MPLPKDQTNINPKALEAHDEVQRGTILLPCTWHCGGYEGQAASDSMFRPPVKSAQGRSWMHDWPIYQDTHNN